MKSRKITAAQLVRLMACHGQVTRFRKLFGTSATVTEARCRKYAAVFDWGWATSNLLTPTQRKAHTEATDQAWKAYDEDTDQAWKAYDEATALAFCRAFNS